MRFVLINQTFYPDVVATGQYLTDVALALVERGHAVTVVTSRRAYDDPERIFPKEETWRGIQIVRAGSTGFGKAARWRRAADCATFVVMCALRALFLPRHDVVVALTSPPLISFIAAWLAKLRGSQLVYWVMDLNPDEAIAAGWLRAGAPASRVLEGMSRFSLRQAVRVIALDRFMRERILEKGITAEKILVLPLWSQDGQIRFDRGGRERFRKAHGLEGKFVVMYSGNHSPCHPLNTLLAAADRLAHEPEIMFCFVGGGSEWRKIKGAWEGKFETRNPKAERNPKAANLLFLPYQARSELAGSLSAADLHVVVMGDRFVGLVHPCKIYNMLAVGTPVVYIGPKPSHVTEIFGVAESAFSRRGVAPVQVTAPPRSPPAAFAFAGTGDVDSVVEAIERARDEGGRLERGVWNGLGVRYSREKVLPELVAVLESLEQTTVTKGD